LVSRNEFSGQEQKIGAKYCGPATIIEVNESVAKIKTDKNKLKTLNVNKLKLFQESDADAQETDAETPDQEANQDLIKFDPSTRRPLTRAWSKLIKSKAIAALITKTDAASSEEIWYKLNDIAFKLYHLNLEFNQLTPEELRFWKQFKQEDIFEWLSGSPIHPPDYSEYIRIRSTVIEQPPQPVHQQIQQPGQVPPNPPPLPSPRKPGRPPGSKNKPKDPFTRAAHYASKRFTRAASKVFSPDTARRNANAPF